LFDPETLAILEHFLVSFENGDCCTRYNGEPCVATLYFYGTDYSIKSVKLCPQCGEFILQKMVDLYDMYCDRFTFTIPCEAYFPSLGFIYPFFRWVLIV
jgi:hypothetical protein